MEERTRCWRIIAVGLCALLLALLLLTTGGPVAHASPAVLSCSGTQTDNYSPRMGLSSFSTTFTVSLSEDYSQCTIPNLHITGGHGMASYTSPFGVCGFIPLAPHYQITYAWSDGEHSTVDFEKVVPSRGLFLVSTGTVIGGLGTGTQATLTVGIDLFGLQILCREGEGTSEADGSATLIFA